jgi:hypothetical protein
VSPADAPKYHQNAFAVRVVSLDAARPPAYRLGMSARQLEELVAEPWRRDEPLVVGGQTFEPRTYMIEIRRCPVVIDQGRADRSFAALDGPPVTDEFLRGKDRVSAPPSGSEVAGAVDSGQPKSRIDKEEDEPDGPEGEPVPSDDRRLSLAGTEVSSGLGILGLALGLVSALGVHGVPVVGISVLVAIVLTALLSVGLGPLSRLLTILEGVRPVVIWLSAGVLLIVGGVVVGFAWSGSSGDSPPPDGSVVDARTGEVLKPEPIRRPMPGSSGGQIEGGNITRACNLTVDSRCLFGDPVEARQGDRLLVRIRLYDPNNSPLNYVKVQSTIGPPERGTAAVSVRLEWPTAVDDPAFEGTGDDTKVAVGPNPDRRLRFVRGSAELLNGASELLARLPDALVSTGGTVLKNVGSPIGCIDCDLDYVRFVQFQVVVT